MKKAYHIAYGRDIQELEKAVNLLIEEGFEPVGAITFLDKAMTAHIDLIVQPMRFSPFTLEQ